MTIGSVNSNEDITSSLNGDDSDDDSRSRQCTYSVREDDEEEL